MKELSSITPRELFFRWWSERWVRGLVLMLIPIGIIDSAYTIAMAFIYGPEIEFNPITRAFLAAGLWFPWALFNILSFTFFCMMAGSYYLHTRLKPAGPDTTILSLIIALRIGMVGYNVTFFYLPWVSGMVFPPFWAAGISFLVAFYWINKLLKRQHDVSWRQTKYYFKSKYDNYRDAKLISSTGIKKQESTSPKPTHRDLKQVIKDEIPRREVPWWKSTWFRRSFYICCSLLSVVLMGLSIQIISELTGLSDWSSEHGPYYVLNEITGPPVMASFLAIIFFMGLAIGLIFKAFTESDYIDI